MARAFAGDPDANQNFLCSASAYGLAIFSVTAFREALFCAADARPRIGLRRKQLAVSSNAGGYPTATSGVATRILELPPVCQLGLPHSSERAKHGSRLRLGRPRHDASHRQHRARSGRTRLGARLFHRLAGQRGVHDAELLGLRPIERWELFRAYGVLDYRRSVLTIDLSA